jgi:carboxylesterase type B
VIVSSDIHSTLRAEAWSGVPLIVGSNRNEMATVLDHVAVPDDAAYRTALAEAFGSPLAQRLYELFPTTRYGSARAAYLDLFGHVVYACQAEAIAASAAVRGRGYLYDLVRGFDEGTYAGVGAFHGIDLHYLFGTFEAVGFEPDDAAEAIQSHMGYDWRALAAKPNEDLLYGWFETWAPYTSGDEKTLILDADITLAGTHRNGICQSLWPLIGT